MLAAAQQLHSFHKPGSAEYESVINYMENERPVHEDELAYVYCKEDLITLRQGREHAWLDRAVETLLKHTHKRMPSIIQVNYP